GVDEAVGGGAGTNADHALAVEEGKNVVDSGLSHRLFELILSHELLPDGESAIIAVLPLRPQRLPPCGRHVGAGNPRPRPGGRRPSRRSRLLAPFFSAP